MTLIDEVRKLSESVKELQERAEANSKAIGRHEEQMNGERGLSSAVNGLANEVKGLRKAAYWVAGLIVAGSITFAFSALSVIQ